jgi:hypothetical protein
MAAAVHVTTDKDAIPDVLSAFETPFNLRYHTSVPLDGNASSVYSGSLAHVISRLLGGYDYVIAHDEETIDIVVWGRCGEALSRRHDPHPVHCTYRGLKPSIRISCLVSSDEESVAASIEAWTSHRLQGWSE